MNKNKRVKNSIELPTNYNFKMKMDLSKDKKISNSINIIIILIISVMIVLPKILKHPLNSTWDTFKTVFFTIALCLIYMLLHELTHAIFLRVLGHMKSKFYIRLPFLCTGSDAYLNKSSFITVALAPVVILGVLIVPLMLILPNDFFLSLYIAEVLNLSCAAGDFFQVYAIAKLPKEALIQDNGKETRVFLLKNE